MPTREPIWRAFYTRPRTEKKVANRLERAGIEVCLPLRTVLRQWSDRKKQAQEPLFPSYLFALVDERQRLDVLATDGVVKTVSFGGELAVVREETIRDLRALANVPGGAEVVAMSAFPAGTPVMVTSGPLEGVRGTVEGSPRPLYLTLAVDAIRQAVRVHVPADWLLRAEGG